MQRININTNAIEISFLLRESREISSNGPGCLYMDRNKTRANINHCPAEKSIIIETMVKIVRLKSLLMMLLRV